MATEIKRPTEPPVRAATAENQMVRGDERSASPHISAPASAPQAPAKSGAGMMPIIIGAAVLILAVAAYFVLQPKPVEQQQTQQQTQQQQQQTTPTPTPASGESGVLVISAFPRGQVVRIADGNGQEVPLENLTLPAELPLRLTVPEGNYSIIVTYGGTTQSIETFVSSKIPLARAHAGFDMEESQFLLEDLR